MQLIDAVTNRHLVQWLDNGFLRTLEPHAFARVAGGRDVLIAFQVGGGPAHESQDGWKLIDARESVRIDPTERFVGARPIPEHLLALVSSTYALPVSSDASPATSLAVPRR
jgi:hypothetical protein